jgi:hypothetical protein
MRDLNNEVVAILSYANNQKKLDVLEECVVVAKSHGFKVILSSAIEVPTNIADKVDYLIIDKENPVISGDELASIGGAIFYNIHNERFKNAYCMDMNHSYAVLKLVKNAASVANINGFEITHYINYDYIINDNLVFQNHTEWLKEFDLVHYYFTQNVNFMNTGFFSVKTDALINCFKNINSKSDFCKKELPVLEEYMLQTFRDNGLNIRSEIIEQLNEKNKLDLITTSDYLVPKKIDGQTYNFFLFLSYDRDTQNYYIITRSNLETEIQIKLGNNVSRIIVTEYARVIKINESMLEDGIFISIPEFNHTEVIDRNKKMSICTIFDNSTVENIEDLFGIKNNDLSEGDFYQLCIKNGADKVHYHGYNYFYPQYIERFRNDSFKFLEIGYGNGTSLPVWLEYFPKADITIADINVELVHSDRCRVVKCDQSKISDLSELCGSLGSAKVIIDDGSHNPIHQIQSFDYLFKNLLEEGGVYIIEDIEVSYWHPQSTLYGYKSGSFNLVEHFKRYQEMINSEFTGVTNELDISTITFAQNSIIITKRTKKEKDYFNRGYRFHGCINDICHFG